MTREEGLALFTQRSWENDNVYIGTRRVNSYAKKPIPTVLLRGELIEVESLKQAFKVGRMHRRYDYSGFEWELDWDDAINFVLELCDYAPFRQTPKYEWALRFLEQFAPRKRA